MRYISDDNRVFNTEQECLEHENVIRIKREEELKRKENFETEYQKRIDAINENYKELQRLIEENKKYQNINIGGKFIPLSELAKVLFM